jgi:long-chain acyl-CoA synthetase
VDGASNFTIFRKVILPLTVPGIAAVAIFVLINGWNEYMYSSVLISKDAAEVEAATMVFQSDADIIVTSAGCAHIAQYCKERYGRRKRYATIEKLDQMMESGRKALVKGKNYYDKVKQDPAALCSIFFTSGSTGFSKGVMLSQRNMITVVIGSLSHYDASGSCMSVLPFTHAYGLVGVMVFFHARASIFICSNLANFMREIPIAKPNFIPVVPLFVETFSKTIWRTAQKQGQDKALHTAIAASNAMLKVGVDKRRTLFKSVLDKFGGELHTLISGGAALDPKLVKEFRSFGIQIVEGYGITECAPVLASNRTHWYRDGSVGHAIPEVELRIDHPDEKGVGEVICRGPNVMLGYYKDPESTAQVIDDEGWFHTGDLGRLDEDGFLFITGRKKSLIILSNGENVSPEELEQYVGRIDEVGEVVVYEDDHAIAADVYPDENAAGTREEIIRRIKKQVEKLNRSLPNYKHIQKLVFREKEFEKTSTRKIKRYKVAPNMKTDRPDPTEERIPSEE